MTILVAIGVAVRLAAIKHELVIKLLVVMAGYRCQQPHKVALIVGHHVFHLLIPIGVNVKKFMDGETVMVIKIEM